MISAMIGGAIGRGGSGTAVPSRISGLTAWYDASDLSTITSSSGAVSQWDDKSGNGNHATQPTGGSQPTTGTVSVNSFNAIDFNGTSHNMILPSGLYSVPNGDNTIFVVQKIDATAATQYSIALDGAGNERLRVCPVDTSNPTMSASNFNQTSSVSNLNVTLSTTVPRILCSVRNGVAVDISADSLFGTAQPAVSFTATSGRIGSSCADLSFLNGVICEVYIYSRALTNAEMNIVGRYLEDKWGAAWVDLIELTPTFGGGITKHLVGFGDSIVYGQGASTLQDQWLIHLSSSMRCGYSNKGVSGTVLQNSNDSGGSPMANNGRDRYVASLTGSNKRDLCIINYGLNDLRYTASVDFTVANYITDYQEIITGLLGLGYTTGTIVLCSPYWIPDAGYITGSAGFTGSNRTIHESYVAAVRELARTNGLKYADVYAYMRDNGGAALVSGDNIHPNNAGHKAIATCVMMAALVP